MEKKTTKSKTEETEIEEFEITEKETEENAASYEKRWEAAIPKIIKKYPSLTKEDLKHVERSEHIRWKVMMKKTGLSREQLIAFLDSLEN